MSTFPADQSNEFTKEFAGSPLKDWRVPGVPGLSGKAKIGVDKVFPTGRFAYVEVSGAGHMVRDVLRMFPGWY